MNKLDWVSERMVFGILIISGYFGIVVLTMIIPLVVPLSLAPTATAAMANAKDSLLVVGPLLGVIVQAIWKADKTDKANAEAVAGLTQAVNTAMAMPAAPQSEGPSA